MTRVTYEIVEHDGGWAYRVDGVYSETFPSHDDARFAAERAAREQVRAGDTTTLSRFAPMALAAYDMIDSAAVDSLTRRRATLLRLHLGDTTAARALGRSTGSAGRLGP